MLRSIKGERSFRRIMCNDTEVLRKNCNNPQARTLACTFIDYSDRVCIIRRDATYEESKASGVDYVDVETVYYCRGDSKYHVINSIGDNAINPHTGYYTVKVYGKARRTAPADGTDI